MNVENFRSVYSIRSYSGFKKAEIVVLYATGALKMQDMKMQDLKLTDQCAGHEIAGHEIDGPICKT